MADNRQKLTDVAQSSVQKSGLRGLSFRTLANEVGIKSSSVHYHFPEKSDLAQALIEQYTTTFMAKLEAIAAEPWSLKRKLTAFMAVIEDVARSDSLCLCGMLAAELESLSAENRTALRRFFTEMASWLTRELSAHADEVNSDLAPADLASVMVSGIEGALLVDRVHGDTVSLTAQQRLYTSLLR
ncbi:MAG: TetR family transcriptional regulator C-terminal domain-containing protein [Pseudomonadota bacterium]